MSRVDRRRRQRTAPPAVLNAVLGVVFTAMLASGWLLAAPPALAHPVRGAGTDPSTDTAALAAFLRGARVGSLTVRVPVRRTGSDLVVGVRLPALPAAGAASVYAADGATQLAAQVRPTGSAPAAARGAQARPTQTRTAVIVLDTSGSMTGDGLRAARRAASAYATAVDPSVRIGLVAFADRVRVLTPPTADRAALAAGIGRLRAGGETALYDGVTRAATLAGQDGTVVLLSDGADTASRADLAAAVRAVSRARTHLDVVAFQTRDAERVPLQRIAAAGGGKVVQAADAAGLGRAFVAAAAAVGQDLTVTIHLPAGLDQRAVATHQLTLAVRQGPIASRGLLAIPAAPVVAATEPVAAEQVRASRPWLASPWFDAVLLLALTVAVTALVWPRGARVEADLRRRAALAAYAAPSAAGALEPAAAASAADGVLRLSQRYLGSGARRAAIALRLDRAGLAMAPHEWLVLRGCIVLTGGALLGLLLRPRLFGVLIGALLAWLGSELWLRGKQSRRCRAFADQLPDTLQLLAGSLRSGFSLPQAMTAVQADGAQPMAAELARALAAVRIGGVLEHELEQIAVRMRSEDWRMAVMAIRVQHSVGGNLAEVLSTTATTLRERAAVTRQVRALSAEGRLSAYILLSLPVGVGLFLGMFRREYLQPLWTTPAGLVMLAGAVIGMVVGTIWTFRVATVEV